MGETPKPDRPKPLAGEEKRKERPDPYLLRPVQSGRKTDRTRRDGRKQ